MTLQVKAVIERVNKLSAAAATYTGRSHSVARGFSNGRSLLPSWTGTLDGASTTISSMAASTGQAAPSAHPPMSPEAKKAFQDNLRAIGQPSPKKKQARGVGPSDGELPSAKKPKKDKDPGSKSDKDPASKKVKSAKKPKKDGPSGGQATA